jgi:CRISPR system Cascade subunit CasA
MNIAFDSWIPVTTSDGSSTLISVHEAMTHGENYADLAVRPHERVALMRLLLCVSHAALNGPKDFDEWEQVPERLPEAADSYLKTWKDSFELFHPEKPWLQLKGLSKMENGRTDENTSDLTTISKLIFENASGNNTTLFDHEGLNAERIIPLTDVVVGMLSFQCFSPGGLISQIYWGKHKTSKSSKDAPCVPSSMVHAFLRGKNIGETVYVNLLSDEDISTYYAGYVKGRPVWESMPMSMGDTAAIINATQTYLGRLVPMTRFIKLSADGQSMLLGDGFSYPQFADGFHPEPSATVVLRKNQKKDERALLAYRPGRAIWRDLGAVMTRQKARQGARGPLILAKLGYDISADLCVCALARDQATILDATESVYHISENMNSDAGLNTYETGVHQSEVIAGKLGWAVETYRLEIDGGWEARLKMAGPSKGQLKARLHSIATNHYWTTVERNLGLLMDFIAAIKCGNAPESPREWQTMLHMSAREAYQLACAQDTPRQMRAFAKGWKKLAFRVDENGEIKTDNANQEDQA